MMEDSVLLAEKKIKKDLKIKTFRPLVTKSESFARTEKIPDLRGLTLREALQKIRENGLQVQTSLSKSS